MSIMRPWISSAMRQNYWNVFRSASLFMINSTGLQPRFPLNIAEGTGKFTPTDRCRYYNTARGSALECAACLDVLVVKKILKQEITEAKAVLIKVVSMLVGLIKAVAPDRVCEEPGGYVARLPEEQVKVKEQDKRT